MRRVHAPVLLLVALAAAACAPPTLETTDDSEPTTSAVAAPASGASGLRAPTGDDGTPLPALDPTRDDLPMEVDQVASTADEDVPSALFGRRDDPAFPPPLIPLDEIVSGGPPPDGIPPIDSPRFQPVAVIDWLAGSEPVVVVDVSGEVRAYPVQILTWHEIVNDTVGGVPVTVAYCPLCNSALAYDRRLGDRILDFGTSGELFNSSLVMYDRQTESLWTHFDARAVAGALTGERLTTYSVQTTSWASFRAAYPDALVLSRDTGVARDYGRNPYVGYDTPGTDPFLFRGEPDPRLTAKERVVVVRDAGQPAVVVRLASLFESGVVTFEAHGRSLVAVVEPGTASPLATETIDLGPDQGSVGVFLAELDGDPVELMRTDDGFVDAVSGRVFDVFGHAVDDRDVRLVPVEHLDTFWFAIAAFEPDAVIVEAP